MESPAHPTSLPRTPGDQSGTTPPVGTVFSVGGAASVNLTDLRQGPTVLIAGLDNPWTMRLAEPLRFHFVHGQDPALYWIEDRKDPGNKQWFVDFSAPYSKLTQDYAIMAHFSDATT